MKQKEIDMENVMFDLGIWLNSVVMVLCVWVTLVLADLNVWLNSAITSLHTWIGPVLSNIYFTWFVGAIVFLNPLALAPQLVAAFRAQGVEGVSILMWVIFLTIQMALTFVGIKDMNVVMTISMFISSFISLTVVIVVTSRRAFSGP